MLAGQLAFLQDTLGCELSCEDSLDLTICFASLRSEELGHVEFKQTVMLHAVPMIIETEKCRIIDVDLAILGLLGPLADRSELASQAMEQGAGVIFVLEELPQGITWIHNFAPLGKQAVYLVMKIERHDDQTIRTESLAERERGGI